jgi:hypothetical protein
MLRGKQMKDIEGIHVERKLGRIGGYIVVDGLEKT